MSRSSENVQLEDVKEWEKNGITEMNIKECIMKNCSAHVIFPWRVLYDNHHSYLIVREIPKEYEAFKFHQVTKRKVSLTRLCSVQRKYVLVMILQQSSSFQNWSVCSNLLPWHWSIHWYTILWSKPNTLEMFFRTMGTKKPGPCFGKKNHFPLRLTYRFHIENHKNGKFLVKWIWCEIKIKLVP